MSSRTSASPCSRAAIQSRCSTSSSATPSRRLRAEASAAAPRVSGRRWEALLWLGPSLALIGGVVFYPAVALVRASLGRYSITGLYQGSVGAENYARLLEQPALPTVLANTAVWVTAVVSITVVISLGLAQLLNQDFPGRALVRWALIVPWAASLIMTSTLFVWIYDYYFGALNQLLTSLRVLPRPVRSLGDDTP